MKSLDFVAILVALIVGFLLGGLCGMKVAPDDCEVLGKFSHDGKAYTCTLDHK